MSTTRNLARIPGPENGPASTPTTYHFDHLPNHEPAAQPPSSCSSAENASSAPLSTQDEVIGWIRQEMNRWSGSAANPEYAMIRSEGTNLPAHAAHQDRSLAVTDAAGQNGTLFGSGKNDHWFRNEALWNRIHANLNLAEQNSQIGVIVPELRRLRGVVRKVARWVARGLLYAGRAFTGCQRTYNVAVLGSLRDLHYSIRQWDQNQQGLRDRERRAVVDLMLRCRKLEKDYADLRLRSRILAGDPWTLPAAGDAERRPTEDRRSTEAKPGKADLDALYVAFEERFRGSRDEIRERLKVYLPVLHQSEVGKEIMPLLDIGCGRGEWLELLREEGFRARGVDASGAMVDLCRQQALDVCLGDALAHLRGLPDASLGGVTGFHIIEHLPLEILIELLDETVRVLKPGGLALFETPNPENVLVGSHSFYLDPTHIRPVPPQLLEFYFEQTSFRIESLKFSAPVQNSSAPEVLEVTSELPADISLYQDYAIVAKRL